MIGLLLLLPCQLLAEENPFAQPETDEVIETFRVQARGWITVPVTIGEKEYRFAIDTGASTDVYDPTLRPHLGTPRGHEKVVLADGVAKYEKFDPPTAHIGTIVVPDKPYVLVSDLAGRWGETAKMKIDGVLGRETLRHFVIRYDPEAGVLEFRRRIGSDPGTPVHLIGRDGCKVMVNVDRVGFVPFLVDTGSSNSGCVARAWLQDAQKFGAARHVLRPGWEGLVLVAFQQDAQVDRLSLGPFTHRDVRLVCSEVNALGTNFLSRYAVTFDFPHRVMYLKPAATYRQLRFYDYHWGVAIHEARENDLVTRVIAPSPASDAGLHVGDVICKIDTLRWRDQSLFDLQELYRRRIGKPVEVVVDRDGVTHTLKLVPREWERAQFEPAIEVSTDWRSP